MPEKGVVMVKGFSRSVLRLVLVFGLFAIFASLAFAQTIDVAMVVKNAGSLSQTYDQKIYDILTSDLGFDVTLVDRYSTVNYYDYDMIVVSASTRELTNSSFIRNIPVNNVSTISMGNPYIDDWGWGDKIWEIFNKDHIYIADNSSLITSMYSIGDSLLVYDRKSNFLGITPYNTPLQKLSYDSSSQTYMVLGIADSGTPLRDGKQVSNESKIVFFGIPKSYYWEEETIDMFIRSVAWVLGDEDEDGIPDPSDNCPNISNTNQSDIDDDGLGDACDDDIDGDGVVNSNDNCPHISNPMQGDFDSDGLGDACDPDADGDEINNTEDNCPSVPNPEQNDTDADGIGDACDDDIDGDNVLNANDNCVSIPNPEQNDTDADGIGDACDDDIDGDAVPNEIDNCPYVSNSDQTDADSDGIGDACDVCPNGNDGDADNDGIIGCLDNCPNNYNPGQEDADGDGLGDACDDHYDVSDLSVISISHGTAQECMALTVDVDVENIGDFDITGYDVVVKLDGNDVAWKNITTSIAVNHSATISLTIPANETCRSSAELIAFVKNVKPFDSNAGNNQMSESVTFDASPRMERDIDNDGNNETAIDVGGDGNYDYFLDSDDSSKALLIEDMNNDGRRDFLIDTDNDDKPEKFWDPSNDRITSIGSDDINNDGDEDILVNTDSDSAYEKVYVGGDVFDYPDLEIEYITTNPGSPKVGDDVDINVRVKNRGGVKAYDFVVEYKLDGSVKDTKTMTLDINEEKTITFSWNNVDEGSYDIEIKVDSDDVIEESNEDNNKKTKTISVQENSNSGGSSSSSSGTGSSSSTSNPNGKSNKPSTGFGGSINTNQSVGADVHNSTGTGRGQASQDNLEKNNPGWSLTGLFVSVFSTGGFNIFIFIVSLVIFFFLGNKLLRNKKNDHGFSGARSSPGFSSTQKLQRLSTYTPVSKAKAQTISAKKESISDVGKKFEKAIRRMERRNDRIRKQEIERIRKWALKEDKKKFRR